MTFDPSTVAAVSGLIVILCGMSFILNTTLRRNDLVGRLWSVAFVAGILETLAYTIENLQPTAWWAIAVGNGAFVLAIGLMWSGLRGANTQRPLAAVPFITSALVALAVLPFGPHGGIWAGAAVMFAAAAAFGGLAAVEASRRLLRHSLNARTLSVVLIVVALYYAARTVLLLVLGPQDRIFADYFGVVPSTLIDLSLVIVATGSLSLIQVDRFGRSASAQPELGTATEAEGLIGRAQFQALSEVWLRRAVRDRTDIALILVKLANRDEISIAFGRGFSDSAVRLMGRVCVSEAPVAALVGRLAPHLFAVLLPMEANEDAERIADRINTVALNTAIDDADRFRAATYIGITSTRAAGSRFDELLEAGQSMLDVAAESGVPGTVMAAP